MVQEKKGEGELAHSVQAMELNRLSKPYTTREWRGMM
jgi:hypothetical protein